jgi:16S rRNA G527 N7-methylase RsmG
MGRPNPTERIRGPDDFAASFDVSRETLARLETYQGLLRQWQKAVNLVAPTTLDEVWHRHFADSAQLLALAPHGAHHWIDLGSGGGFPGLVIAILMGDVRVGGREGARNRVQSEGAGSASSPSPRHRQPFHPRTRRGEGRGEGQQHPPTPEQASAPHPSPLPARGERGQGVQPAPATPRVTLIESDARKAAFLREAARQTAIPAGVSVDILSTRAESARIKVNGSLPRVICARALAPLDRLLELAAPLSPPGTTGLYLKGKTVAQELRAAEKMWNFNVELIPSVTDRDGRIAVITRLERKAKD